MSQKFWIGTVSKEHVERGKIGGFAQVCHGKQGPLKRMQQNDILIYYSPSVKFGGKIPYQCFTALGVVADQKVYQFEMSPDFVPYRRNIQYLKTVDTPIRPLIPILDFIRDKNKWGYVFRFGILQIEKTDFINIAQAMHVEKKQINDLCI
jgi:hypothetical protein